MARAKKNAAELEALAMLTRNYDISSDVALYLVKQVARNYQIIADADKDIAAVGLIARGGKNGAPYQNPSVAIRHKTSELIERQMVRLEQFKKAAGADELE
jgi:hypothetical protein